MMKTRVMHLYIPGYNLFSTTLTEFARDDCVTLSLSISYGSFKTINFLMLPIISGLFFKSLEASYRKIFQLPPRHLLFGQAFYVIISVFAGLLFFMSNFIWIILSTVLSHILNAVNNAPYVNQISRLAFSAFTSHRINLLSAAVLVAFYLATIKLFLNVKIRLRHRLASAIVFCLLWIVARKLFSLYISHITEVSVLYGSLSSVIVILMWIFYSSLALLFSIELLYTLHSGHYHYRQW
jgi:membrane protein